MDSRIEVLAAGLVNCPCGCESRRQGLYSLYWQGHQRTCPAAGEGSISGRRRSVYPFHGSPAAAGTAAARQAKEQMELMAEVDALEMSKWTATSAFAAAITYRNRRMCRPSA